MQNGSGATSDDDFLTAFERCTIPRPEWTHAAHVRMAWLYLTRLPWPHAREAIRTGIQRYNAAVGSDGYHETITVAFTTLIRSRLLPAEDFATFQARNPDLFDRKLTALQAHYSREVLFSPAARERFIAPDQAPLPDEPPHRGG